MSLYLDLSKPWDAFRRVTLAWGQTQGQSFGSYERGRVLPENLQEQRTAFVEVTPLGFCGRQRFDLPRMVLRLALLHQAEFLGGEGDETVDVLVFGEGLPDVVRLRAKVEAAVICHKKNSARARWARRNIQQFPAWGAPNSVKFSFQHYLRELPNRPTQDKIAAMMCNLTVNQREALVIWRVLNRAAGDKDSFAICNDLAHKTLHIRFQEPGRGDERIQPL